MTSPITLPAPDKPLYRQVQAFLATDTHPTEGLLAALGNGANSIFPNFTTDGPHPDRAVCPTPFIIVVPGGTRALDKAGREFKVIIEIHDDLDAGDKRWPGLLHRVKIWLITLEHFRPVPDAQVPNARYVGGVYFEEESPPNLPDDTYDTNTVQLIVAQRGMDRTSNHGYQG